MKCINKKWLKKLKIIFFPSLVNKSIKYVTKCGDIRCGRCPFLNNAALVTSEENNSALIRTCPVIKNLFIAIVCDGYNHFLSAKPKLYLDQKSVGINSRYETQNTVQKNSASTLIHADADNSKCFLFYKLSIENVTERKGKKII